MPLGRPDQTFPANATLGGLGHWRLLLHWTGVSPGIYPSPVQHWTDVALCITQRARIHNARATMPSSCPQWTGQ